MGRCDVVEKKPFLGNYNGKRIRASTNSGTFEGLLNYDGINELLSLDDANEIFYEIKEPKYELLERKRKAGKVIIYKKKLNHYELLEE